MTRDLTGQKGWISMVQTGTFYVIFIIIDFCSLMKCDILSI